MTYSPFTRRVKAFLRQQALLPEAGVVVVACSGGADSLALLLVLHELCGRPDTAYPQVALHVAHLDHGLRGAAGAADAAFVAEVARERGLPCATGQLPADEVAGWRGSVETNARAARYHFLRAVASQAGADRIAVGHTMNDQAETVLMHFIRGSGLQGLAGMRPRNGDLIRLLLHERRAATVAYCQAAGLTPREDATNADPRFARNWLRRDVLPNLATAQPNVIPTLARNAENFAEDADFMDQATDRAWSECVLAASADAITLNRAALRNLHIALRRRVLRRASLTVGSVDPDAQLNRDSIDRLDRVIMDRSGARRVVQLANGADAVCQGRVVSVQRRIYADG